MADYNGMVSIALCTYNGEDYLAAQLDSLLSQTYRNIEIIAVDDCSTDSTFDILQRYQLENPLLKIFRNDRNLGLNENFRKALSLSQGEYIAIADQDDIWVDTKIAILLEKIQDGLLIYHDSGYITADGTPTGKSTASHHRFVAGKCPKNLVYFNCVSGHASMLSKQLLQSLPPFPDKFYYDWWLAYTAACLGGLRFTEQQLVLHRLHAGSFTHHDNTEARKLRIEHITLFLSHPLTPAHLKDLLTKLLNYYAGLGHKRFSAKLLMLLAGNQDLFLVRKKSAFSRFRFILKECNS